MRISILSLFLAVTVAFAGPLAFAGETAVEQTGQAEEMIGPEAMSEVSETETVVQEKVAEASDQVVESDASGEDCSNSADDDGDEKVDCDDEDCAADPGCQSGS